MTFLEEARRRFQPPVAGVLKELRSIRLESSSSQKRPVASLRALFPETFHLEPSIVKKGEGERRRLKVGALFSGGPASGGHNVLAGLWDAMREIGGEAELIGFLNGPGGLIEGHFRKLSAQEIDAVRNQGGFDLIGTGRTKIETGEQMASSLKVCQSLGLDGLVIIGGDDSNTNAAFLAEFFLKERAKTSVIGVPKTIDGDLQSEDIEISFGFDTACKTYAELIGNIARDAKSARKYTHFIKLMGRSASHIALECALLTHPNLVLIGEERKSLEKIVKEIADLIQRRKQEKKEYGVILVPEGLIEFIPEMGSLIQELNQKSALSKESQKLLESLPASIQRQLQMERDPHGNIAVSQIETDKLLIELVKRELGGKLVAQEHFCGYEGRSAFPSNFDATYGYNLGRLAALAIRDRLTGGIVSLQGLSRPPSSWQAKVIPLVHLLDWETRKGKEIPVIKKTLVDIKGKPLVKLNSLKKEWELGDRYQNPGPIQFFGEHPLIDSVPQIVALQHGLS